MDPKSLDLGDERNWVALMNGHTLLGPEAFP